MKQALRGGSQRSEGLIAVGLCVIRGSSEEDGAEEEQANARPQLRMTGLSFLCRNAGLCTRGKSSAMHTHAHTHTHTQTPPPYHIQSPSTSVCLPIFPTRTHWLTIVTRQCAFSLSPE